MDICLRPDTLSPTTHVTVVACLIHKFSRRVDENVNEKENGVISYDDDFGRRNISSEDGESRGGI